MSDEYNLQRFIVAQDPVYDDALSLLRRGTMCLSCMEFMFPRLAARGIGAAAEPYAIRSLDEASAYLDFPVLGARFRECVGVLGRLSGLRARAVFGDVGAKQLHASLTLFSEATDEFLLESTLDVWFDGLLDEDTMNELDMMS